MLSSLYSLPFGESFIVGIGQIDLPEMVNLASSFLEREKKKQSNKTWFLPL